MIGGLPIGFAQPLVLLGLLSLPVLWWLLRLIPPRPRRIAFPPARLLFDIAPKEETPARTPWWLTALRLGLTALAIVAAAGPMWNPPVATSGGARPLALLIDDGWAAAASWQARVRTGEDILARAEADNRPVAVIPVSDAGKGIALQPSAAARIRLRQHKPKPHTVERTEALPALTRFSESAPDAEWIWLSDAIDIGRGAEFVTGFGRLMQGRTLTVIEGGTPAVHALTAADNAAGGLSVKVLRAQTPPGDTGTVRALDLRGLPLGEAPFSFAVSGRETEATLNLPVEIRNDIARLEIAGERSAGAVQLLDKRWRRRTVGVVTGASADTAQPLLASTFYLSRALSPFADVRLGERISPSDAVSRFLDQKVPMLILADVGNIVGNARARLAQWINEGGVLVRFAGPRLAAADDELVPVRLRRGGRVLGGSLTWEKPQPLAAFSREGPFAGMNVPGDVTVNRQVLADHAGRLHQDMAKAWRAKDANRLEQASRRFLELIRDLNELLATREEFLLGGWLEDAKRWGTTAAERAQCEWNARRVLTLWGETIAINDYARRQWSGMLDNYYAPRWKRFLDAAAESLRADQPLDSKKYNEELLKWIAQWSDRRDVFPTKPRGDSIAIALKLWAKYADAFKPEPVTPDAISLTTGKPTTCSSALPQYPARLANDGMRSDSDRYWATDVKRDPAAWWQVDLERPTAVGRVVIVCFHRDNRYYGFTVEVSNDAQRWEMVANRRDNQKPSTEEGYSCIFAPRPVRYIRVTQTHNSANTGRHLVEVMAFER